MAATGDHQERRKHYMAAIGRTHDSQEEKAAAYDDYAKEYEYVSELSVFKCITVTLYKRCSVWNRRQFDCLSHILFRLQSAT